MDELIVKLKTMKYFSSKEQETEVEKIITSLGIKYTYQPNGTQKYPDFRLSFESNDVDLECKSSALRIPMWNCSYPKKDTLYVFSSKIENSTFVFFGCEVVSEEISAIYEEYAKKHKDLQIEINNKLSNVNNPYKMKIFARNMFTQAQPFRKMEFKPN